MAVASGDVTGTIISGDTLPNHYPGVCEEEGMEVMDVRVENSVEMIYIKGSNSKATRCAFVASRRQPDGLHLLPFTTDSRLQNVKRIVGSGSCEPTVWTSTEDGSEY